MFQNFLQNSALEDKSTRGEWSNIQSIETKSIGNRSKSKRWRTEKARSLETRYKVVERGGGGVWNTRRIRRSFRLIDVQRDDGQRARRGRRRRRRRRRQLGASLKRALPFVLRDGGGKGEADVPAEAAVLHDRVLHPPQHLQPLCLPLLGPLRHRPRLHHHLHAVRHSASRVYHYLRWVKERWTIVASQTSSNLFRPIGVLLSLCRCMRTQSSPLIPIFSFSVRGLLFTYLRGQTLSPSHLSWLRSLNRLSLGKVRVFESCFVLFGFYTWIIRLYIFKYNDVVI